MTLRAVGFAKASGRQLLWVTALGRPLWQEKKPWSPEVLKQRREQWLQLRDPAAQGIMGLLPLVRKMLVRFTETTGAEKKIFKSIRGILRGLELQQVDGDRGRGCDDPQVVLSLMPLHILVRIKRAELTDKGLPKGVFRPRPVYQMWTRDKAGNMNVRRYGFALVPGFVGAARSYTGGVAQMNLCFCRLCGCTGKSVRSTSVALIYPVVCRFGIP